MTIADTIRLAPSAMTTLDPQFLRAVVLMTGFKPSPMLRAQAALLTIALRYSDFTAADIPKEITNGSKHLAGCATGALIALGLLTVIKRVPSPDPAAKGRKLDLLRLTEGKTHSARAWLKANDFNLLLQAPSETFQPAFL
jgi:hypothetical protein